MKISITPILDNYNSEPVEDSIMFEYNYDKIIISIFGSLENREISISKQEFIKVVKILEVI